jgi:hypothetical protein
MEHCERKNLSSPALSKSSMIPKSVGFSGKHLHFLLHQHFPLVDWQASEAPGRESFSNKFTRIPVRPFRRHWQFHLVFPLVVLPFAHSDALFAIRIERDWKNGFNTFSIIPVRFFRFSDQTRR